MRKVFIVALALLMTLVGMSAAAESAVIEPLTTGQQAVLFSNGYTGFCLDLNKNGTVLEDKFVEADASIAVSNYYENLPIAEYLKLAFVFDHLTLFMCRENGGYYDAQLDNRFNINHLVWLFSDYSFKSVEKDMGANNFEQKVVTYNPDKKPVIYKPELCQIVVDAIDRYNAGYRVSDDGVVIYPNGTADTKYLFDTTRNTSVRMNFKYLEALDDGTQDFFAYKITYFREVEVVEGDRAELNTKVNVYKTQSNTWTGIESGDDGYFEDDEYGLNRVYTTHRVTKGDHGRVYRCVFVDKQSSSDLTSHYQIEYVFTLKVLDKTGTPVVGAPVIEWYPIPPASVEAGSSLTLRVETEDETELTWYVNKGDGYVEVTSADGMISGDGKSFTIADVSSADGYKFKCEASNSVGSDETSEYTLVVSGQVVPPSVPPVITDPKEDQTVIYVKNENIDLNVIVEDDEGVSYKWFRVTNGSDAQKITTSQSGYEGAASDTLTIKNVGDDADASVYYCVVEKNGQSVTSKKFTLKELTIAWDCTLPESVTENDSVVLKVAAENAKSYVWYEVVGSEAPKQIASGDSVTTYTIANVKKEDSGNKYYCVAKSGDKTASTTEFVLTVVPAKCELPVISGTTPADPANVIVVKGTDETLGVTATSENKLEYQWFVCPKGTGAREAVTEKNAENSNYKIPGDKIQDGDVYICVVTSDCGAVVEQMFTLKELSIAWSSTLENNVSIGGEAVLSVTAQNASKLEWYVKRGDGDFEKIADETGTSLTINPVTMEDDGSDYYCKAINGKKEATTVPVKLSVLPMEVTDAEEIPYRIGDDVTLTKDDASSKKYTWYEKQEDGTVQMMPGVTAHAITLSNRALAHDGDVYYCVAQDSDGLVSCTEFTLKLLMDPPVITTPEESTEIPYFPGETVTLTVTAENAKEYQWMVDKGTGELEEIPDANESSYTTDKLGDEQDGWVYVCRVSNEQDTVLTSAFILCKVELPQMPSTGDASMMSLWMILMIGAASALASLLSKKRGMTR